MSAYHPADRLRWSLNCRPVVRATIGDRALWADFARLHRDVPRVAGVVTHPSTVDPTLFAQSARTLGDSHGKMNARGFYSFAPTADLLTDVAPVEGGTMTRGSEPTFIAPTEDTSGLRWSMDRIGSGHHLRGATRAHDLRVNGAPMSSRPVTLGAYTEAAETCNAERPIVSLWSGVAALVSLMAGRNFTPRTMSADVIVGATWAPVTVDCGRPPKNETGRRPRQTRAAVIAEALVLAEAMWTSGSAPKQNGRPSNPQRIARAAFDITGGQQPVDPTPIITEAASLFIA